MARKVIPSPRSAQVLFQGSQELARLVGTTFGPHGGKVAVSKLGEIVTTTDGASLVREVRFADLRRIGSSLVREAALSSDKTGGDGSTTTVLLTHAILEALLGDDLVTPRNLVGVVNEIRAALQVAEGVIESLRVPATGALLERVGLMATHGDPVVADPVREALLLAGENGTVILAEGEGTGIELDHREGLTLPEGWASHALGDGTGERVMDGPLVAVVATPLLRAEDVTPMMEEASQWPGRGLVVFAPRISGEALSTMILNNEKGVLPCCGVTFSGHRGLQDWLEDLAAVTNAQVADAMAGRDPLKWEAPWLGYARKILVTRHKTTVLSYMDEEIEQRVEERIRVLFARAEQSEHPYDQDRLRERASSLDGGLCTVKIGGFTKPEAQDRRSRAEDALHAMQGALRSGVVPGAGMAYYRASQALPDTHGGYVLSQALLAPLRALAVRARQEPEVVVDQAEEGDWRGWDPIGGSWRDFLEAPEIVDPLDVVLGSLRAAVSVACEMALTGAIITRT